MGFSPSCEMLLLFRMAFCWQSDASQRPPHAHSGAGTFTGGLERGQQARASGLSLVSLFPVPPRGQHHLSLQFLVWPQLPSLGQQHPGQPHRAPWLRRTRLLYRPYFSLTSLSKQQYCE